DVEQLLQPGDRPDRAVRPPGLLRAEGLHAAQAPRREGGGAAPRRPGRAAHAPHRRPRVLPRHPPRRPLQARPPPLPTRRTPPPPRDDRRGLPNLVLVEVSGAIAPETSTGTGCERGPGAGQGWGRTGSGVVPRA